MTSDDAKRAVGQAAAAMVQDGMCLGLGTGSTTAFAIEALGARVRGGLHLSGVATSFAAERLARQHGVPLVSLEDVTELDLAIDGADEVFVASSGEIHVIKGRGGAQTRERIVADQAGEFVVLVDASKRVERLGARMPVPVEVLPMAASVVERALRALGAETTLRMGVRKDGPVVTDQGFWIIDSVFAEIDDPKALARSIKTLPGVLDHGLFVAMADTVLVGEADGSVSRLAATRIG
jgi:ribose 5-phosphate isomerase A